MNLESFKKMLQSQSSRRNNNSPLPDSSEKIYISPLALIKMLKHARAGVPMEVMGLMLGEFVDDYTTVVQDVFAMPQKGTSVTVESVDPVFQTEMLEMLRQTNRSEMVIGWYHSHPGFGCWLSSVDTNTQQSFESLNSRAVAVVVDPIQSVRGKVMIDAFRLIGGYPVMPQVEFREHTSTEGFLSRPTIQKLIHGLNKAYYSINIDYRKTRVEEKIMCALRNRKEDGKEMMKFSESREKTERMLKEMLELVKNYNELLEKKEEISKSGQVDPKDKLGELVEEMSVLIGKQSNAITMASKIF